MYAFENDDSNDKFFKRFLTRLKYADSSLIKYIKKIVSLDKKLGFNLLMVCLNSGNLDLLLTLDDIFTELVKVNINEILKRMVDMAFDEPRLAYMIARVDPLVFITCRRPIHNSMGETIFLSHLIKCSTLKNSTCADSVYKILSKALHASLHPSELKTRLGLLTAKDGQDMSFMDYAYLTRHATVTAYIGQIGDAVDFGISIPTVKHLRCTTADKCQNDIDREIQAMTDTNFFVDDLTRGHCVSDDRSWLKFNNKNQEKRCHELAKSMHDFGIKNKGEYYHLLSSQLYQVNIIEDLAGLQELRQTIINERINIVAIDAEFAKPDEIIINSDNQPHEKDQISMITSIQICIDSRTYFIDFILMDKKDEAKSVVQWLLENSQILKVFHSCHSDLKNCYTTFNSFVSNIFDTAKHYEVITGEVSSTISLARLAKLHLSITMDKSFQKSNWKIRPVPSAMLEYAISDAAILMAVFCQMIGKMTVAEMSHIAVKSNRLLPVDCLSKTKVDMDY